jgi:hypothetical protein
MAPRKASDPYSDWDWVLIGQEVRAKRGEMTQGRFGRIYGLEQGQVSKLETGKYSKNPKKRPAGLEKALTAMLRRIPRLALAERPDPDAQSQGHRDNADPPELQRGIALFRQLYRDRRTREHDWHVVMGMLVDVQEREAPKARKR